LLQAVFFIPPEKSEIIAPFFFHESGLIKSCLDGCMGKAYGDHTFRPGAALLCIGDFACFGGDPNRPAARQLAGKLALEKGKTWLIPVLDGWEEHIAFWKPVRMDRSVRYAIKRKAEFDKAKLLAMTEAIPPEFSLHSIDKALYEKAMAEEWSRDFCSQYQDGEDYVKRGLGVAALRGEELVAGASSYVIYDGGIEIQTDTRVDMRRRGLAAACCARLILNCLQKGLTPSWDAANPASLALAQKLGYALKAPYDTWEVTF
jgi:RimJ/RimL family protein N-acetyltransferase